MERAELTWGYRMVMAVSSPVMRRWGRLEVVGLENLSASGPTVLIGNHDSYWDPVAIGVAGVRRRQIRARAPVAIPGRRRTAAKYRARAAVEASSD